MLIHTWLFLAWLPVVSHVWGRAGQGKDALPLWGCSLCFVCPLGWPSPSLWQGHHCQGHSQSQAGFQGAAVLWGVLLKLQTAFPKHEEQ